jgi:hypothetical protein
MKNQLPTQPLPGLKSVEVSFEHSQTLPSLLEQLELSVLLSTYQAGRVVSVSRYQDQLRLGFSHFDQAMGLCRTARGIAVSTRDAIWSLPAHREIAAHVKPGSEHGIAFLVRSCHHSGLLMNHDLAWDGEGLRDSLSHRPRTEVLLESGPRNLRCWLEAGLWAVGVIRALARTRSFLDKVPSWLPPPPATTG